MWLIVCGLLPVASHGGDAPAVVLLGAAASKEQLRAGSSRGLHGRGG